MSHDIVTVGEAMLRIWVPAGERLEDAPAFRVTVAGAEANVAMAAARTGARTAWLSSLPANPLGRRAAREIASHGVDVSHIHWSEQGRMGTYFVELSVPPRPITVVYDRTGSAASRMDADAVAWPVLEAARIVHISGITPALSPSCLDLSLEVVRRAHQAGAMVVLDVNYRRNLWTVEECRGALLGMAALTDLIILTAEDARDVFSIEGPPGEAVKDIATTTGAAQVVLTAGAAAHWFAEGSVMSAVGYEEAETLDRIGAGDAFAAGVLLGLLDDDLPTGVRKGLAMSALKLGIYGDQLTASADEVDRLMEGHDREVSR